MSDNFNNFENLSKPKGDRYFLHIGLFLVTLFTTTLAGAEWIKGFGGRYEFYELSVGLPYSLSILFVLSLHEFGHYFAAKIHGVKATLPFFIPFPSIEGFLNFGTLGAVIKTRTPIQSKKVLFDVGVAGPIAGFVASVGLIIYGFTHLPGVEYILSIHPDYFTPSSNVNVIGLEFGDTILFASLREIFAPANTFIPPMNEIYHYPYLCVGWFGLFVTAMNLLPVGQLDGGHITYAMFGEKIQTTVASITMIILITLGLGGFISIFAEANIPFVWSGWLLWSAVLFFIIKVKHPPIYDYAQLSSGRRWVGYFSYFILIVSFSPSPFIINFNY